MKIKSIVWLLKRPAYWSQGFEIVKRRIFNQNDELGKGDALQWCSESSIGNEFDALEAICERKGLKNISEIYPERYSNAVDIQENCKVQMGGPGAISFLYHCTSVFKPEKVLETGVAYGWSSWAILLGLAKNNYGNLISIDMPYVNMENDDFVGCIIPQELRDKWKLLRLPDRSGIPKAIKEFNNEIDFVHYDSDKSYQGRKWAYPIIWRSLKKGGIFISDDIGDNIAFKEFCDAIDQHPIIFEFDSKSVGLIIKE